jgi:hypothetical protein
MVKVYWYKISVVYDTLTVTGYISSKFDSVGDMINFVNFDKCKAIVWRDAPHTDAPTNAHIFEPTYKYIKVEAVSCDTY